MTPSQRAKERVFRAAMRSFNIHVKEKGSVEAFLSSSFTPHGKALIQACAAALSRKRGRKRG